MMEYSCFDLGHFGVEKKVTTLQDFVHLVDAEFDFSSLADVLLVCTIDGGYRLPSRSVALNRTIHLLTS